MRPSGDVRRRTSAGPPSRTSRGRFRDKGRPWTFCRNGCVPSQISLAGLQTIVYRHPPIPQARNIAWRLCGTSLRASQCYFSTPAISSCAPCSLAPGAQAQHSPTSNIAFSLPRHIRPVKAGGWVIRTHAQVLASNSCSFHQFLPLASFTDTLPPTVPPLSRQPLLTSQICAEWP